MTHFTPVPGLVFCLRIERMMAGGHYEYALLTWLTYHAMLRPSDPLLALVGDVVLPSSIEDILGGERGVFQIRRSKRVPGVRLAIGGGIFRPRQVVMF